MAVALPAGAVRDQAIADITEQWAQKDPRAALGWAETLVEGQDAARQSVLAAGRKTNPRPRRHTLRPWHPVKPKTS